MADGQILEIIGLAGTGAAAIGAALLGHRYVHVLSIREEHRQDLRNVVLREWQEVARSLSNKTDITRAAGVDPHENKFFVQIKPHLEQTSNLWPMSRKHWPSLHDLWLDVVSSSVAFDREVLRALHALEGEVEALGLRVIDARAEAPPDGEWMALPSTGGGPASVKQEIARLWSFICEAQTHVRKRKFLVETGTEDGRHHVRWRTSNSDLTVFAITTESGSSRLVPLLQSWLTPGAKGELFNPVVELANRLMDPLAAFLSELDRLEYDRNLVGTCDFCPRFLPVLRARRAS